jgi:hypothetical protein
MPSDSTVWIVLIVAAFIVIFYALWKGRGLKIRKEKDGFSVETEAEKREESSERIISVGKGIEIENATAGDIAGIKSEDADRASGEKKNIEVASNSWYQTRT